MLNWKPIRVLMVLAFSMAMSVGFTACEAFDETDDDMDQNIGQIQQADEVHPEIV